MGEERLLQLEKRLAQAETRLAIFDLEAEYARTWDAADSGGWAALFTGDGVFDMIGVGDHQRRILTGHAELEAFCRETTALYQGLHFMHLPSIRFAGGAIHARVHFEWIGLFRPHASFDGRRTAAGYYDTSYVIEDGVLRMKRRIEKAMSSQISENYDVYLNDHPGLAGAGGSVP